MKKITKSEKKKTDMEVDNVKLIVEPINLDDKMEEFEQK